jgi:hypothetical protein
MAMHKVIIGFAAQPVEDTCAFFVAFSSANRCVVFTFCKQRTTSPPHQDYPQAMRGIRPLYEVLGAAGVKVLPIEEWPLAVAPMLFDSVARWDLVDTRRG